MSDSDSDCGPLLKKATTRQPGIVYGSNYVPVEENTSTQTVGRSPIRNGLSNVIPSPSYYPDSSSNAYSQSSRSLESSIQPPFTPPLNNERVRKNNIFTISFFSE